MHQTAKPFCAVELQGMQRLKEQDPLDNKYLQKLLFDIKNLHTNKANSTQLVTNVHTLSLDSRWYGYVNVYNVMLTLKCQCVAAGTVTG